MTSRSPAAIVAMGFLLTGAFGGLAIGLALLFVSVSRTSLLPAVILAYGLASLAGAIGISRPTRWALPLIVVSQGLAAAGLLYLFMFVTRDGSMLVAAAVSIGAIVATLVSAGVRSVP